MARLLLVLVMVLTLGATACGRKGNPLPPEDAPVDRPRPGR